MSSLLMSDIAGLGAIALEQQSNGAGLSDIARAVGSQPSAVQRAIQLLRRNGLVERLERARYRLVSGPLVDALLALSSLTLPRRRVVGTIARSNDGVEFAAADERGFVVVTDWTATPGQHLLLRKALGRLPSDGVTLLDHDDLRARLVSEPDLRERAQRSAVIKGSAARSFPDRTRHGSPDARALRELNPGVRRPSSRALRRVGDEYGLRRLTAFGSAVRADTRPDSDIDLMFELRPGSPMGMVRLMDLTAALEDLFERDVDLLNARFVPEPVKRQAQREGVVLYERA